MESPRISVIMPVFNGEDFLQESIDSILNQTYPNFEFLIGDDGSTDNSWHILSAQKDPRIRLFRNERNLGIAVTLNILIDSSKGEFIARQDCDDISLPERLKKQVKFLDNHPDIGLCGTFVEYFGSRVMKLLRPVHDEEIKAYMLVSSPITHPTVMFRRSVLEKLVVSRYDQSKFPAEDYAMWFEFSRKTKLANLREILLKYRFHGNNITVTNANDQIVKCNLIRKEIFGYTLSYDLTDHETQLINSIYTTNFQNRKELSALESLLLRMLGKNRETHYYNEQVLQNFFAHLWRTACFKTVQISFTKKVGLYLESDLFHFSGLLTYLSWRNMSAMAFNRLH